MTPRRRLLATLSPSPLLALFLALPAWAQDEGDDSTTADAASEAASAAAAAANSDEMSAFEATADRFSDRMREFSQEARSIVERREIEDKTQLWEGYKALLDEMARDERKLRETAVSRFESFLSKYPSSAETPRVMFRLAEMYFEMAEEDWLIADQEYNRFMESLDASGDLDNIPDLPRKDYGKSIALYQRIIANHPDYEYLDGAYYMLGYVLSDTNAIQYDETASLKSYQALVDRFPNSDFASAAHLQIGEYYFDYNDLNKAIFHYGEVVRLEGKKGNLYDEGLYKLAWSHYKQSNYDQALSLMNELLDFSEEMYLSTGKESSMAKEAIEYTAISFSDVADQGHQTPVQVARAFYARVGERPFEPKVYKRLAYVLEQQARYEEAIDVYRTIQDRWPNDPENPSHQWRIAELYISLPVPDAEAAQRTVTELNDRYNEKTAWWEANRDNPDALDKARGYIEKSLSTVANAKHALANETGNPADFAEAAKLYEQYLNEFPFADDYYEVQWYLADTLFQSGAVDRAEDQYAQLYKSGADHNYKEMALYRLALVRRQEVINAHNSPIERPASARVQKTVKLPSGKERTIYDLGKLQQEYIQTNDELMAANLRAKSAALRQKAETEDDAAEKELLIAQAEEIIRYADALDANRPALAYESAQIFYNHGQYEEARKRFMAIIETWPERDEAAYSATLVLDSFVAEENLEEARTYAADFRRRQLGQGGIADGGEPDERDFANREEQFAFKIAEEHQARALTLGQQGNQAGRIESHLKAAEEFDAFTRAYPKSQYYRDALYNVGYNYRAAGRLDQASAVFRKYVDTWPDDKRSWPLLFEIANNYASTLDLQQAVQYYDTLYAQTKGQNYEDAPTALYNAAFLRIGMGDYRGAAENFERYASEFSGQPDAEAVMFAAGKQWEKVSADQAIRFYDRYLDRYRGANADHTMEAVYQIARLTEESGGRGRAVDDAWRRVKDTYSGLSGRVGPAGRHYAAMAEYREIAVQQAAFKQIKFTSNDEANAKLLIEAKPAEIKALEDRIMAMISTYQDFEASSAGLYALGSAYLAFSDMAYNAPVPKGLDEDEQALYQETIDTQIRLPLEEKGRTRLQAALDLAKSQGGWSEWQTKALDELSTRFPADFAPEKQEIRGVGESAHVPSGGPVSVRPTEEEKQ